MKSSLRAFNISSDFNLWYNSLNVSLNSRYPCVCAVCVFVIMWLWNDICAIPDSKVHGANMGPTWFLSAPDGPHVGSMNLAIRDITHQSYSNPDAISMPSCAYVKFQDVWGYFKPDQTISNVLARCRTGQNNDYFTIAIMAAYKQPHWTIFPNV